MSTEDIDVFEKGEDHNLEVGDQFVGEALSPFKHKDTVPNKHCKKGRVVVKNPLGTRPTWLVVQGGRVGLTYRVEVVEVIGRQHGEVTILEQLDEIPECDDKETPWWLQHHAKKSNVWSGTPQRIREEKQGHNDARNHGDIRGSKNNLLRGNR